MAVQDRYARVLTMLARILPRDELTPKSEPQPDIFSNANSSACPGKLDAVILRIKDGARSWDELICEFAARFEAIGQSSKLLNRYLGMNSVVRICGLLRAEGGEDPNRGDNLQHSGNWVSSCSMKSHGRCADRVLGLYDVGRPDSS